MVAAVYARDPIRRQYAVTVLVEKGTGDGARTMGIVRGVRRDRPCRIRLADPRMRKMCLCLIPQNELD